MNFSTDVCIYIYIYIYIYIWWNKMDETNNIIFMPFIKHWEKNPHKQASQLLANLKHTPFQ